MKNIKTKSIVKHSIKTIDKSKVLSESLNNSFVKVKSSDSNDINEDISNKTTCVSNSCINNGVYNFNKVGRKSVLRTKDNISKLKVRSNGIKTSKVVKVKNYIKTNKSSLVSSNILSNRKFKTSFKIKRLIEKTSINTLRNLKMFIQNSTTIIKGAIFGSKLILSSIIAGGWIAVLIILITCLIGLFSTSIFGIFLSSEKMSGNIPMNEVVNKINNDFVDKISYIQKNNIYDDYVISSNRAEWKEVLAIYTVKTLNDNNNEIISIDDDKIKTLEKVFWDMNNIEYYTSIVDNKDILYLNISSKSVDEMIAIYNFNGSHKKQVYELLNYKYITLWSSVIYGNSIDSTNFVEVAISQIGNIGGEKYWSWYGFNYRVEWCAIFVSYIADQVGYIDAGIIPKFASCSTQGIPWFKAVGRWEEKGYIPKSGDIIFFDWDLDGISEHVGIVEKVENSKVYVIEGNSSDVCKINVYSINSSVIFGHGVVY